MGGRNFPVAASTVSNTDPLCVARERQRNLKIVDLQQPDFLRTLENAIQFGTPVLMQNIGMLKINTKQ